MKRLFFLFIVLCLMIPTAVSAGSLGKEDQFYNLVIFIRFQDEIYYNAPYEYDYYDDMFNDPDEPSLRDYYLEASYNQLTIDSLLVQNMGEIVFYTDINPRSYYEPYDVNDNPNGYQPNEESQREHDLLERALEYAEAEAWFNPELDYDANDDGILDSITFMISREDSGWNTLLWPHKWDLYRDVDFFGLDVQGYTVELLGDNQSYDNQVDVSVLAHETFHLIGAPDLYHYYDYFDVLPVGEWGLMESEYGPSHMLGYMKYKYGEWIDYVPEITESGSYELYPLQDSPDNLYRIRLPYQNEWIYLEYRDNVGQYESNLPSSGLLVYRINQNVEGNENGSYLGNDPSDEVFVFRPHVADKEEPIMFVKEGDVDGDIYNAALSQYNTFDEANTTDNFILFSAEGYLLDIQITNVVEHDGYLSFDIAFPPRISLDIDIQVDYQDMYLVEAINTSYPILFTNIDEGHVVHYTMDGSTPTLDSPIFDGSPIYLDSAHPTIKGEVFDGDNNNIASLEESFQFVTAIETDHYGYGDMEDIVWVLHFDELTNYKINFDDDSYTEPDYDYSYINGGEGYSADELAGTEFEFTNDLLLFEFESDEYLDNYFGILGTITVTTELPIQLEGSPIMSLMIGDDYTELGLTVTGGNPNYTWDIDSDFNNMIAGDYEFIYTIYDNGDYVGILRRIVRVIDNIAPIVELNGASVITIEHYEEWIDPSITVYDNAESEIDVFLNGFVFNYIVGTYDLTYIVSDASGNITTVSRTVHVVDVTAPEVHLNPGVDTVQSKDDFIDALVSIYDAASGELIPEIESTLDDAPGTYEIMYTVTDNAGNSTTITRIVTVLGNTDITPLCDPMVQTVYPGESFEYGNCYINDVPMTPTNPNWATSPPAGLHEFDYQLEVDGTMITNTVIVYVLADEYDITLWLDKKEGWQ